MVTSGYSDALTHWRGHVILSTSLPRKRVEEDGLQRGSPLFGLLGFSGFFGGGIGSRGHLYTCGPCEIKLNQPLETVVCV